MKAVATIFLVSGALILCSCRSAVDSPSAATQPVEQPVSLEIDRSQRPGSAALPESSFPEYEMHELDSGLAVYVVESDRQPTVTYRLMFRSGSLRDGAKPGVAELLAGMLDKGVEGKSAFELAKEIDFMGARLSASASSDFTVVSISGLANQKEKLLSLLASVVLEPSFPQEELDKLKQRTFSQLISEKRDPAELVGKLRRLLVYGKNGYGTFKTEKSVRSIERKDLISFHNDFLVPNNASMAIVGDVDADEIVALVEAQFSDWEAVEPPSPEQIELPEVDSVSIHIVDRDDSVQSSILVAQQSVLRSNPDVPELRVVMSVLGGGFSGRMFQNLREDKGFTYGAGTYAANAAKAGSIVSYADVRNEVTTPAVEEIILELERIRAEPIPDKELEMHKQYLIGNYILSLENPMRTAERIQEIDVYGLEPDYYRSYVSQLDSVTPEMAQDLAQRYIDPRINVVAIAGKAAAIADELRSLGEVTLYDDSLEQIDVEEEE